MTDPSFSIVVPTYRRPEALRRSLAALAALEYDRGRYEVIVVDDGTDPGTAEVIRSLDGRGVEFALESQQGRGAATARNAGAGKASGDFLLFVDDDIIVGPDHLRRHRAAHAGRVNALVNGAWEFAPEVLEALTGSPFGRFRIELERRFQEQSMGHAIGDGCVEMPVLGTWDLSLSTSLFRTLDGFDEEFPVAGAEDLDFSLRAKAAGATLLLDERIRCLHNDDRLTLRSYCSREERSAQTMPFLARKHPEQFGERPYIRENRPVRGDDPPALVAKKAAKAVLSTGPALEGLYRLTTLLETVGAPERVIRRLYTTLLGLHLFRGVRRTWVA